MAHPVRRDTASDLEKSDLSEQREHVVGDDTVQESSKEGHVVAHDDQGRALLRIDKRAEAKLVRKLDFAIIPWVFLMYLWSFIDRINIGNARVYGFERDLGMSGYDYNVVVSVFFVSSCWLTLIQIAFEIPSNLACKVVGPGWFLPLATTAFGIVSLCTAFVKSFGSLLAVRFLLGATECSLLPGTAYFLTRWYTRREAGFRMALFLLGAPLSGAFGGFIAYGVVHDIASIGSLTTWRNLFLVEGLCTTFVGMLSLVFLADRPETARFLNAEEKALAISRIKGENVDSTTHLEATHKATVRQGLFNVTAWSMGLVMLFAGIAVQGFSVFLPTIISGIYPTIQPVQRNLRSAYPYLVGLVGAIATPLFVAKTGKRALAICASIPIGLIGYAMFVGAKSGNVRYGGAFLVAFATFPMAPLAYGWAGANLSPDASRAAGIGIVGFAMNIGGLISSWTYLPSHAPRYTPGNSIGIACCALIFFIAGATYFYCKWENRQRAMGKRDHRLEGLDASQRALLGHKHPLFKLVH